MGKGCERLSIGLLARLTLGRMLRQDVVGISMLQGPGMTGNLTISGGRAKSGASWADCDPHCLQRDCWVRSQAGPIRQTRDMGLT